jgi:hypothetical protein
MAQAETLHTSIAPQRWRIIRGMLALQVVALIAMYLSGHWDAAEHAKGAVDRFWYPPHYGIYFAILAAALLSMVGLLVLLWDNNATPFAALRQNAALTLVVVANGLSFSGAPADALWHEIFGIDLTVWSPPHLHLLLGQVLSALGCIVYFLDDEVDSRIRLINGKRFGRTALTLITFVTALLISAFLFFEYESSIRSRDVLARPLWAFPLLWPFYVGITCSIVFSSTRRIGMITAVAVVYDVARLAAVAFDLTVLDYQGALGFPLIVPALIFDLAVAFEAYRGTLERRWSIVRIGALTTAVLVVATPLFFAWRGISPDLTVVPWTTYWPAGMISGIAGAVVGRKIGIMMRRLRPQPDVEVPQARRFVPVPKP